jgi:DNA (cytosine-5)-methyltransferase 1
LKKTVVELFAGVGGFRCAFNDVKLSNGSVSENGKWDFVWANQWEPNKKKQHAYKCYAKRFGLENVANVDICSIDKNKIPDHSLLVGGFPCQDYSVAQSLSTSKGIQGKKGVLWWEIHKTIKEKKTPFLLLENVDRLLISPAKQRGRDFGIMLKSLHDLNYDVEWRIINAADYGHYQKRRRVYIFAYKRGTDYKKSLNSVNAEKLIKKEGIFSEDFSITLESEIQKIDLKSKENKDLVKVSDNFVGSFKNTGVMIDGVIYTAKVKAKNPSAGKLIDLIDKNNKDETLFLNENQIKKFDYLKGGKSIKREKNGIIYNYTEGKMDFPDSLNKPGRTMLTSEASVNRSSHIVSDPKNNKLRFISPIEAERLNEFPDNWTDTDMPKKFRYFTMGNALVVGVVKKISKRIEKIIIKEK